MRPDAIQLLRQLGLNQLEAEVYKHLLANPPMTAYAVGKALARPTANVYKAIDALVAHGAVIVEEGGARVCRAVSSGEFLRKAQRRFTETVRDAEAALRSSEKVAEDERVYRLESVDAVFERARSMIRSARRVVVLDAFPRALARIVRDVEKAAARKGVEVFVEAYSDVSIAGAEVVIVPGGDLALNAWKSEQLNLVVDGREHLLALLDRDLEKVLQAVWSRSVYLSCLHHSGRMNEITLIRAMKAAEGPNAGAAVLRELRRHRFIRDSDLPGHHELLRRYLESPAREAV